MDTRLRKLAGWAGVLGAVWYVVLYVVGFVALRPEFLDDPTGVADLFDDRNRVLVGSWLLGLSVIGLLWFAGALSSGLRSVGEGRLGAIAMSGAAVAASAVAIGSSLFAVGALRVDDAGGVGQETGVGPGYLLSMFDGAMILNFAAAPFGLGILVLAAAAAGARTGRAPTWLVGLSVLLALALWIPPISWAAVWVFLAWVLYAAWELHRAGADSAGSAPVVSPGETSA